MKLQIARNHTTVKGYRMMVTEEKTYAKRQEIAEILGIHQDDFIGGLDLVKAARVLGIAPSTLRQRALAGQVGFQRDGRRWIFSWADLAAYVGRRQHAVWAGDERGVPAAQNGNGGGGRRAARREREEVEAEARRLGLL